MQKKIQSFQEEIDSSVSIQTIEIVSTVKNSVPLVPEKLPEPVKQVVKIIKKKPFPQKKQPMTKVQKKQLAKATKKEAQITVNPSSLKRLVVNQSFVPQRTKLTKKELNENAIKFKSNIESELSNEKCEVAAPVGTMSRKSNKSVGARYECIYKNFLREVR
jgi:hypothetical protein